VAHKELLERIFAGTGKIFVNSLDVSSASFKENMLTLTLTLDIGGIDEQIVAVQPLAAFLLFKRKLHCLRENGVWKIWQDQPMVQDAAEQLLAAVSDEERHPLLTEVEPASSEELRLFLSAQGMDFFLRQEYPEALRYFSLIHELAHRAGDEQDIAFVLELIGIAHSMKGEFDVAAEKFERSLVLYEKLGDKVASARMWEKLGFLEFADGDYPKAESYFQRCLVLYRSFDDRSRNGGREVKQ
jgi:tetratricopeptide (TPR) repeat protein